LIVFFVVVVMNRFLCKRAAQLLQEADKRCLLARRPSGRPVSSTLDGRHAAPISLLQDGASGVPRSPSLGKAVLQLMRTSLAGPATNETRVFSPVLLDAMRII
jgi:hypothetical protein